MMISCPSCRAHYAIQDQRLMADGLALACSSCGHNWIERRMIDQRAIEIVEPEVLQPPSRSLPAVIESVGEGDTEVRRLVEAAKLAQESFRAKRAQRLKHIRNWAILGTLALSPVVAAAAFPVPVVKLAPVTFMAYERLGYSVNVYGLDIRRVEQQHIIDEGARVLSVKGEIINVAGHEKKIPWIRFGLKDGSGKEVYSWTLDTGVRPLRAAETTSFVTRVAAPPESAQTLEIRFARADEIGSKN